MATLFRDTAIEQLCTKVTTGATPLRSRSEFYEGGTIDWYKTGELKDWYLEPAEERITKQALEETSVKLFPANTVLMAMYGDGRTITSLGILRSPAATNQACSAMLVDDEKCDSRYFFYALKNRRHLLLKVASGGAQRNLSGKLIKEFTLPIPPLPTQQRIAAILSAYDELIENCQRRIKILEQMARGLYREWFLNFRFPNHAKTPMVDSPMGKIPKGWEVKRLAEVAEVNRAQISARTAPETLHYIDISSVSQGQIDLITPFTFADAPNRARRIVQHEDILWSCVRPNRRSYALVMQPLDDTIASTGFAVLTATNIPFAFLYQATTTDDFVAYLTNNATGSAYPAVTATTFQNAKLIIPPEPLLTEYGGIATPMAEEIHVLQRRIQNLRKTRDLLLPRLMSGQITVN